MNKKVIGKGGISALVIADSISKTGIRILTFEVEFPRFILSEYNTHRQFSRNAASSRAIPVLAQLEAIADTPAMPIFYGKNQPGMSAKEEIEGKDEAEAIILAMRDFCSKSVKRLNELGVHKQTANRYIEPWQWVKGVVTATEYNNFFYLRNHAAAQPEIAELARCMEGAMEKSRSQTLCTGDWHLPYLGCYNGQYFTTWVEEDNGWANEVTREDAIKISASLCAQVSYRKSDESIDKALKIYDTLVNMKPVHASPFEHQATPMAKNSFDYNDPILCPEAGITHTDTNQDYWSGNLRGWIQNRQLIPGHVYGN